MGKEKANKFHQPQNAANSRPGSSGGGGASGKSKDKLGGTLVAPLKAFGQNFLKNPMVVQGIVEKAGIRPTDVVFEIGPGTGNLTVELLKRAKKVICVEFDRRMVREILKRVEGTDLARKLQVIHGDILKVAMPYFDVCVANIPYNISSPLLFKLLKHRPFYREAVIMFQEEFAMRLTAKPGEELYCRLTVNTQLLAKVEHLLKVGRNNFRPPPKVDSRVVRIVLKNPPPPINFLEWDGLVRLLFNRKNKTLRALLCTKAVLKMLETNYKTFKSLEQSGTTQQLDPSTQLNQSNSLMMLGDNQAASNMLNDDEDDDADPWERGKKNNGSGGGGQLNVVPSSEDLLLVKGIIEDICSMEQFGELRSAKMDQDDILALLEVLNARGIHFS